MNIESYVNQTSAHFKLQLKKLFRQQKNISPILIESMQYSVLSGGKYFRPLLVYSAGESLELPRHQLDAIAIAIELIHAYSLIHDDLPAMDNASLRRGQTTCHLKFSEADAILAGDALQMLAMETLTNAPNLSDKTKLKLIRELAVAARRMVAGQSLDILAEGKTISLSELQNIHSLKTGSLIGACLTMPALIAASHKVNDFKLLASKLGVVYQIQDDILDIEASTETLGKQQGLDATLEKSTYPKIMGLTESKEYLAALLSEIITLLETNKLEQSLLAELIKLIFQRTY